MMSILHLTFCILVTQDLIQYFWKMWLDTRVYFRTFACFLFTSAAYLSTELNSDLLFTSMFLFIFSHFQGCLLQNLC